jgi:phosphoribosylformimino-5-aminoimidazole carboxamide ribotide isomerase
MLLIPAIDLKDGKCVRLLKGAFDKITVYGEDPPLMAERWAEAGAKLIHLVDLDASLGKTTNRDAIKAIRKRVSVSLELGGGIKDMEAVRYFKDIGIDDLVMGTAVSENPQLVREASSLYPGCVVAALDSVGRKLKTWGWKKDGGKDLLLTAASLKDLGVSKIIHTDVERDGTQEGPNIELARQVAKASSLPVILSGGVSGEEDLKAVKKEAPFLYGVISGKALYAGTLDYSKGMAILGDYN